MLDRVNYIDKMMTLLSDSTKFLRMHCDDVLGLTVRLEDKINRFLNKLKKVNLITEPIYKHLFVSGSAPGILYGLPKVHKNGIPLRPILAAYNTAV